MAFPSGKTPVHLYKDNLSGSPTTWADQEGSNDLTIDSGVAVSSGGIEADSNGGATDGNPEGTDIVAPDFSFAVRYISPGASASCWIGGILQGNSTGKFQEHLIVRYESRDSATKVRPQLQYRFYKGPTEDGNLNGTDYAPDTGEEHVIVVSVKVNGTSAPGDEWRMYWSEANSGAGEYVTHNDSDLELGLAARDMSSIRLGKSQEGNTGGDITILGFAVWNEVLTQAEMEAISPSDSEWTTSGGSTVSLSGGVDASSVLSGDLAAERSLSGDVSVSGSLTGDVSVTRGLSGDSSSSVELAGDLNVTRGLDGSVDASLSLGGDLEVSGQITLAGDINSSVSLSGDLTATVGLGGDVQSSVQVTGDLTTTTAVVDLAGAVSTATTISGDVTLTRGLAGDASVTGTLTGSLGVTKSLSGEVSASVSLTGVIGGAEFEFVADGLNERGMSFEYQLRGKQGGGLWRFFTSGAPWGGTWYVMTDGSIVRKADNSLPDSGTVYTSATLGRDAVFAGGRVHPLDSFERSSLIAAGYGSNVQRIVT